MRIKASLFEFLLTWKLVFKVYKRPNQQSVATFQCSNKTQAVLRNQRRKGSWSQIAIEIERVISIPRPHPEICLLSTLLRLYTLLEIATHWPGKDI